MIALAILLCFVGFTLFSMANNKHYDMAFPERELGTNGKWIVHVVGWVFLIPALLICVVHWDTEIGATVWVCMLQLASLSVSACLTYLPGLYIRLCRYGLLGQWWSKT